MTPKCQLVAAHPYRDKLMHLRSHLGHFNRHEWTANILLMETKVVTGGGYLLLTNMGMTTVMLSESSVGLGSDC